MSTWILPFSTLVGKVFTLLVVGPPAATPVRMSNNAKCAAHSTKCETMQPSEREAP
jgi:hypothetical protein